MDTARGPQGLKGCRRAMSQCDSWSHADIIATDGEKLMKFGWTTQEWAMHFDEGSFNDSSRVTVYMSVGTNVALLDIAIGAEAPRSEGFSPLRGAPRCQHHSRSSIDDMTSLQSYRQKDRKPEKVAAPGPLA